MHNFKTSSMIAKEFMLRLKLSAAALIIFFASSAQQIHHDHIPDVSFEELGDRMNCLASQVDVPVEFNQRVKDFVDYFTIKDRDYSRQILTKKDRYFRIFEPVLEKYDLPDALKYLAIVESGLRPDAVSRASAVGLWQFIRSTGKIYGLKANWYVDDRMDPYLATDAACRHLKDLYNMFGDWELALAAYNSGPGNVRKAIRRSGYKKKFWEIYRYLPRETRSYVPQFTAIIYTLNYADKHNLFPEEQEYAMEFDTIHVSQYFHLETFANQLQICVEDLIELNPQIKRGALPGDGRNYVMRLPQELKDTVVASRHLLYDSAGKVGKKELEYLARNEPGSTYGREKRVYRVRSGDVLGLIAQRHNVRISDLKKWNNLRSNLIRVGQRLNIWVLPNYNSRTKSLYQVTARSTTSVDLTGKELYTVEYGDTLWGISKKTNLSVAQLKALNNLNNNNIRVGQALIISAD